MGFHLPEILTCRSGKNQFAVVRNVDHPKDIVRQAKNLLVDMVVMRIKNHEQAAVLMVREHCVLQLRGIGGNRLRGLRRIVKQREEFRSVRNHGSFGSRDPK